jgi:hypothetical protein
VHRVDVLRYDGLGERANTEWFSALDFARKTLKNPLQVPSHIKERNNTENEQQGFK